jgi:hypothetical protein
MSEKESKYIYFYSESLEMKYAINKETSDIYCQDKTMYKLDEVKILSAASVKIDKATHNVKKIFEGEIVKVIKKSEV